MKILKNIRVIRTKIIHYNQLVAMDFAKIIYIHITIAFGKYYYLILEIVQNKANNQAVIFLQFTHPRLMTMNF